MRWPETLRLFAKSATASPRSPFQVSGFRFQISALRSPSDIRARPRETLHALYRFLNLDPTFVPPALERVHNPANSHFLLHLNHRVPLLARLMQKVHRGFGASWKRFHIPVQDAERAALQAYFAQPNKELAALLTAQKTPLPTWLE